MLIYMQRGMQTAHATCASVLILSVACDKLALWTEKTTHQMFPHNHVCVCVCVCVCAQRAVQCVCVVLLWSPRDSKTPRLPWPVINNMIIGKLWRWIRACHRTGTPYLLSSSWFVTRLCSVWWSTRHAGFLNGKSLHVQPWHPGFFLCVCVA